MSKVRLDWRLFEKVAQQLAKSLTEVPWTSPGDRPLRGGYGAPADIDERIRAALADAQKHLEANPDLQSRPVGGGPPLDVNDLHRSIYLNDADIRKRLAPVLQQHFTPPHLQPGWVPYRRRIPRDINGDGQISRTERYAPTMAESEWKRMGSTPEGRQEWAANVRANLPNTGTFGGALAPGPRGQKPQRRLSINNSMIKVIMRMAKQRGLTEEQTAAALFREEPGGPRAIGYAGDVNQARLERALNAELVKRGLPPQLRHWQKPTPKHLRMPAAGSWGSFWESAFPSLMAKREKARSDEYDMRRQMLHLDRPAHHLAPRSWNWPDSPWLTRPPTNLLDYERWLRGRSTRIDPDNPAWKTYDK